MVMTSVKWPRTSSACTVLVTGNNGDVSQALNTLSSQHFGQHNDTTFEVIKCSLSNDARFTDLLASTSIDYLFLVPTPSDDNLREIRRATVLAARHSVKHVILLSIISAASANGYFGAMYRQCEMFVQASTVPYTICRCAPLIQNFAAISQNFHHSVASFSLPISNGAVAPVHASDVASAALHILCKPTDHAGRIYTLTGPELLTGVELAGRAASGLNRPVSFRNCSIPEAFCQIRDVMRGSTAMITGFVEQLQIIASGQMCEMTNDVFLLTGRPAISLESFFSENRATFLPSQEEMAAEKSTRKSLLSDTGLQYANLGYRGNFGNGLSRYEVPHSRL